MLSYEPKIIGIQTESLSRFGWHKSGWRGREAVNKWSAQAPWEEFISKEASGTQHACGNRTFAERLATLQLASHNKHHPLHGISFSYHLLFFFQKKYAVSNLYIAKNKRRNSFEIMCLPFHPWSRPGVWLDRRYCRGWGHPNAGIKVPENCMYNVQIS